MAALLWRKLTTLQTERESEGADDTEDGLMQRLVEILSGVVQ